MKLAEFTIRITGEVTDAEFDALEPHLESMAAAIETEAELIFDAKLPAHLASRVKFLFIE